MLSKSVKDVAILLMREGMPLTDAVLAGIRITGDDVTPEVGDALFRAAKFNPTDLPIRDFDSVVSPGYMDRIRDANIAIRVPQGGEGDLGTILMQRELRRKAAERYALDRLGFTEPPLGPADAFSPVRPTGPVAPLIGNF